METRGRKPKERKGYFYEREENAIVQYIRSDNEEKKNQIYNEILHPALSKMIESIIRRYKLFVPDEEFDENFNDTISYLLTKIKHYKPVINEYEEVETSKVRGKNKYVFMEEAEFRDLQKDVGDTDPKYVRVPIMDTNEDSVLYPLRYFKKVKKKYKAYSYCGTVCRNYLMYKCSQYSKKRKRNTSYDTMFEELNNDSRYSVEEDENYGLAERLVNDTADGIMDILDNYDIYNLSEDEIVVGRALVNLLRNWETILPEGSNKLQKSAILYSLREETMMTTKQIRDNMKKYFALYAELKKKELKD
jgi:hypothetical protein